MRIFAFIFMNNIIASLLMDVTASFKKEYLLSTSLLVSLFLSLCPLTVNLCVSFHLASNTKPFLFLVWSL